MKRIVLIDQMLDARTDAEMDEALTAVDKWLEAHPDDAGMVHAMDQLTIMRFAPFAYDATVSR